MEWGDQFSFFTVRVSEKSIMEATEILKKMKCKYSISRTKRFMFVFIDKQIQGAKEFVEHFKRG